MAFNWLAGTFSVCFRRPGAWAESASRLAPTARPHLEAQLNSALAENARLELLLGSTRHSVGNHLALLSAMLARQARATAEPATRATFLTATSRVSTIAEMMRGERVGAGDLVDARNLVDRILRTLRDAAASLGVSLEVEVGDFALNEKEALPLVVILDELVVNSLKHGFPGDVEGVIRISFLEAVDLNGSELSLSVEDDGVGVDPCVSSPRFGAKVISSMVKTLGATLTESPRSGDPVRPGLRTVVKVTRK